MENSVFLNSHWAITQEGFARFASYDLDRLSVPEAAFASLDSAEEDNYKARLARFMAQFEEKITVDEDGVGSLSICGPIMPNPDAVDRYFFKACDSVRVAGLIRSAASDDRVKSLVIYINSPGGMVVGTPEVENAIRAFNESGKTSIAFADTLMASAAYWIGSQASVLVATESALLGSIGVIRPHVDASGMYEKIGLKVEIFRGGKHKVAGAYNTKMSSDQRELIQDGVDEVHRQFQDAVRTGRGKDIDDDDMQGQVFYAADAIGRGLADEIVDGIEDAYGSFVSAKPKKTMRKASTAAVDNLDSDMSKELDTPETVAKADLDAALAQVADLQGQLAAANEKVSDLEASAETQSNWQSEAESRLDEKNAQISDLQGQVESANAELAALKADFDAKVLEKADELAESKAAAIAAQSGTDPALLSEDKDGIDEASYAGMNQDQLWDAFAKIKDEQGADAARVFYRKHIYR